MELFADEVRRQGKSIFPATGRSLTPRPDNEKGIMSELRIGDNLPVDLLSFRATECLVSTGPPGSEDMCILDDGHTGSHLAAGPGMVVKAIWG
jgi:hypothetical protein